ncbi:MAG TPA: hypothetical protein HA340_04800 [Candidatus Thalassarchaeaceae archaeon]|jgi:hypothetical protein|nr:hypothetical protein [Euryarchaeota archaeon]MDP6378802.1 hypothetical protein [Candidatus Thalassarchaeaceae archaeon]DAC49782.1 MAG TPA: hypothetical protein D7H97_04765 [Candidatus Poseidoniales archaeon]HIH83248.1 hypothetical protein [Candidatus Thalassarchaeaceae archaeon]|tara:strand:+ start:520 stop:783 length:264 start_codon:yes stop_codon:yes gene_type:complete
MAFSVSAAYGLLFLVAGGLLYVVWRVMKRNQESYIQDNAPAIAGSDELGGQAKDKSQFDEPNEDALDEMADVLASAAEAQGIEYEED